MDTAVFQGSEFVCVRQNGRLKTNFPQLVWLEASLARDRCANDEDLLSSLAVNMLQHLFPGSEWPMAQGQCSHYAKLLYPAFVAEILSSMPENGGNLPVEVVREWAYERLSCNQIPELNQCAS